MEVSVAQREYRSEIEHSSTGLKNTSFIFDAGGEY